MATEQAAIFNSSTKSFRMHPHLLWDVIVRQAGTLGKALLEGVMNSVDAQAGRIDLAVDTEGFRLADDGGGFGSEEDVDNFFATFGAPHNEGDARFGRFRMGRGQMFAFAKTEWISNQSRMVVDIKAHGLNFEYTRLPESRPGCVIEGKFYERLNSQQLVGIVGEVQRNCLYLDRTLTINGRIVNRDPSKMKWDHTTDDAYFNLSSGGARGIDVYQQGVFVETIPAFEFGLSGVVVTRVGHPLEINFARNQVLRSCPLFKKILAAVGRESKKKIATRRDLDDSERAMLIAGIAGAKKVDHEIRGAKIFRDVTGRFWSPMQITRLFAGTRLRHLSDGRHAFSVAPLGDLTGDVIMQERRAFVFEEENFRDLGGDPQRGLPSDGWFGDGLGNFDMFTAVFVDAKTLAEDMRKTKILLEDDELTPKEKVFLDVACACSIVAAGATASELGLDTGSLWKLRRSLRVGLSEGCGGWTDGSTYIAISRNFISGIDLDAGGVGALALLLVHEYCHQDDDSNTDVHSPEFYRAFHDASEACIRDLIDMGTREMIRAMRKGAKKLTHREEVRAAEVDEMASLAGLIT